MWLLILGWVLFLGAHLTPGVFGQRERLVTRFGEGRFLAGYISTSVTGMVCIGFSAGAYNTEVIRGAVLAVPSGQIEAAKAIGMSTAQRFWRVLLPQVARYALPGLGNVWQLTLKETSLISVIGLVEIMRQAAVASGSTKEPFTFYLVAALLYLGLTSISNRGFNRAGAWASRGVRYG